MPEGEVTFEDLIHGPITFSSDVIGDFIIKRTDGGFSYNFAVVVDDAGMEITHVIRGEDHITNTARQMMLFAALGEEVPRYGHHSLILAPDGSKMSKRHGATSIGDFKGSGVLSAAVVNYLALLSWHPADEREKFTLAELIEEFDIGRVSKSPAIFDIQKLNWLNGLYIRELSRHRLYEEIEPYLSEAGIRAGSGAARGGGGGRAGEPRGAGGRAPFRGRVRRGGRSGVRVPAPTRCWLRASNCCCAWPGRRSRRFEAEFVPTEVGRDALRRLVEVAKEQGLKGKAVYHPLRVALSGRDEGPELFYLVAGLGKSAILARLDAAAAFAAGCGGGCRHAAR